MVTVSFLIGGIVAGHVEERESDVGLPCVIRIFWFVDRGVLR